MSLHPPLNIKITDWFHPGKWNCCFLCLWPQSCLTSKKVSSLATFFLSQPLHTAWSLVLVVPFHQLIQLIQAGQTILGNLHSSEWKHIYFANLMASSVGRELSPAALSRLWGGGSWQAGLDHLELLKLLFFRFWNDPMLYTCNIFLRSSLQSYFLLARVWEQRQDC